MFVLKKRKKKKKKPAAPEVPIHVDFPDVRLVGVAHEERRRHKVEWPLHRQKNVA